MRILFWNINPIISLPCIQQSPLLDDFLLFFQAGKGMNKQRQTLTRF
ncbi:hypothetical protein HOLDEFILI_00697 [Holdemania filiformis DSM 12042]|uniref:Uncharacterized protein n=1 Tax=Holdemania filiformis DSM 12042 TaxID=545696 RepID=B9Y4G6_9FIRM|nr:hypothetical protein HOLDEFILI_00697 [Holdemania filiformis DSM 12042]